MKKRMICLILLLIVAPLITSATLVCLDPTRWGGSINFIAVVSMAVFGLFSVPIWPTYIPVLVITPILMEKISSLHFFWKTKCSVLYGSSLILGALAGPLVMMPLILLSKDDSGLALCWAIAGAVSGSFVSVLIVMYYRYEGNREVIENSPIQDKEKA